MTELASLIRKAMSRDRQLTIVGAASIGISLVSIGGELLGLVSPSIATVIVLIATGIGFRFAFAYLGRAASPQVRIRLANTISNAGLLISGITMLAALPVLTQRGGAGPFLHSVAGHAWTLAALILLASPVRTMTWRAFVGIGLTGFFGVTGLARLIGRPIMVSLGSDSILGKALLIPLLETLCLALPIVVILAFAMRRATLRPSAIDLALVGAWAGAGFALYEDTQFGRSNGSWLAAPPLSMILPSMESAHPGVSIVIGGHAVWIALVGLGLGFGLLYRQRYDRAWIAIPVSLGVVFLEHANINALSMMGGEVPWLVRLVLIMTLGGCASSILLFGGIFAVLAIEWRALGAALPKGKWWLLGPAEAYRRGQRLGAAQVTASADKGA